MTLTHAQAQDLIRRGRNGSRRLGNNTCLYPVGADDYAVQYHSTYVVTIHADGTYTLNSGGWDTITTKERINDYGPARVSSQGGKWHIGHSSDPRTEPKIKACRKCRGAGRVRQPGYRTYREYDGWEYKRIFPPVITLPRWAECWNCGGTGRKDYGSKPMSVIFYDGIRVDSSGRVLDADVRDRMNDPEWVAREREAAKAARAAAKAAEARRLAESRPATNPGWLTRHALTEQDGEVIMFKAVRDDLRSYHGAHYMPGNTVVAEDYDTFPDCGAGLHFSPTARMAHDYDPRATRYLACAVDLATMIIINDGHYMPKVKAQSCRVLYEVDLAGDRLPEPEPELPETGDLDPVVFG